MTAAEVRAAKVLADHRIGVAYYSDESGYIFCTCGRYFAVLADGHQHQSDMLAAAGLLVKAEHDRQVAARAWGEGMEAATAAAPGDVWFDSWSSLDNPYIAPPDTARATLSAEPPPPPVPPLTTVSATIWG